jgi:hypothetical protein
MNQLQNGALSSPRTKVKVKRNARCQLGSNKSTDMSMDVMRCFSSNTACDELAMDNLGVKILLHLVGSWCLLSIWMNALSWNISSNKQASKRGVAAQVQSDCAHKISRRKFLRTQSASYLVSTKRDGLLDADADWCFLRAPLSVWRGF